jgi:hypothetical protein
MEASDRKALSAKLKAFAADVTSIDVVTLTGALPLKPKEIFKADGKGIDFEKLHGAIVADVGEDSKLDVAAFTHVGFDGDTVQFSMEASTDSQVALIDLHRQTVKDVQTARNEFITAVADAIRG